MQHQIAGRHLGRNTAQRKTLFRSLITDLFRHERIKTTEAKAKAVRGDAEQLITLAKRGDLHARRLVLPHPSGKGELAIDAQPPPHFRHGSTQFGFLRNRLARAAHDTSPRLTESLNCIRWQVRSTAFSRDTGRICASRGSVMLRTRSRVLVSDTGLASFVRR